MGGEPETLSPENYPWGWALPGICLVEQIRPLTILPRVIRNNIGNSLILWPPLNAQVER